MKASDIAAGWGGARLATLVFGWDIYMWEMSGPRLVVKGEANPKATEDELLALAQRIHPNPAH